ncbi:MAG: septum formation initiator family protein [Candidatus Buchananbacteria bacterium]|nr:septum formation initiator family protein [Candidatus Buchananbacteria bacterium]
MKQRGNSKPNRFWESKFFLLIGIIVVSFVGLNIYRVWSSNHAVNQEIDGLKNQIEIETQKNSDLSELIEYLNSSAYVEKKARMDLGLKKAGEKAVVVTDLNFDFNQDVNSKSAVNVAKTNVGKWWQYFFR